MSSLTMSRDNGTEEENIILTVDDDRELLNLLRVSLERAGFQVWTATTAAEALRIITHHGLPHLVLVDVMLPGMDGIQLARAIHSTWDIPIIMLTALNQDDLRISSLEQYAEDYIVKPFSPGELVARIRRILLRVRHHPYAQQRATVVDGELTLNLPAQEVIVRGQTIPLSRTETKILHILAANAGRTVSTKWLLQRVWPLKEVYEDTLRVHIHRLRRKLEPNHARPRYVLTERGEGYRFLEPDQAPAIASQSTSDSHADPSSDNPTFATSHKRTSKAMAATHRQPFRAV